MLYVVIQALIIIIFHNWFKFLPISSGDLGFFFKEHIVEYLNPPFMWETFRNLGFGGDSFISQGVYLYNLPMGMLGKFLDYGVIERIIWFYPILILGFFSPFVLAKTLKITHSQFFPFTILIYLLNTYFFMIMGGGQLTVVAGYLAIPLVFATFISVVNSMRPKNILLFSLLFSFLVAFDFRYAYIFLILVFAYFVFSCIFSTSLLSYLSLLRKYIIIFFIALIITLGTQAYWILPYVTNYHNPTATFTSAYTSSDAVTYFSFATFEHSLSLLHPLWPENIFGKVGFMKPEFLLIPIIAFSSLLFLSKKRGQKSNQIVLFFAILGIIGAFLAKGAKPPFGELYLWLFAHIPGFVMFRDPTKWYTLVTLSYSVLIPLTIAEIYEWLVSQKKISIFNFQFSNKFQIINTQNLFLILTTLYLILLIRPAIFGELGGTFKPVIVPQEYTDFKNFLINDNSFSRVLWIPTLQRFSFYSNNHPAISGKDYFNTYNQYGTAVALQKSGVKELLEQSAVKYIVVPDDTQKEIFIQDRKYDNKQYNISIQTLKNVPWLKQMHKFGKVIVFELGKSKGHFWSLSPGIQLETKFINPTKYTLTVKNAQKGDVVVFSEYYDSYWRVNDGEKEIHTAVYHKYFNSFVLRKKGNYKMDVSYKPQEYVPAGMGVSIATVLILFFYFMNKTSQFMKFKYLRKN